MRINIQRQKIPKKIIRKIKLNTFIKNSNTDNPYIGYDWQLYYENKDENIQDFHLFCISIVRDLFEKKFKTNETGSIIYKYIDFNSENTILQLYQLLKIIETDKIKNLKNDI